MFSAIRLRSLFFGAALLAALGIAACNYNPTSPFEGFNGELSQNGATLKGRFATAASLSAGLKSVAANAFDGITVTVLDKNGNDTGITTGVSSNGSFTLRGLPAGSFTLVFKDANGDEIGRMTFDEVKVNQEITIVVALDQGGVQLLEEKRDGIGHGDIEIEGQAKDVQASSGANGTLTVNGYSIVSKDGTTSIRKGNRRLALADIHNGDRVHVKGVWETSSGGSQHVMAHEIKLQEEQEEEDSTQGECLINGGKVGQRIELEGRVESGGQGDFMLRVNGNRARGPVRVTGGSLTCTGKPGSACTLGPGNQVHVRGTLSECSSASARVDASEVKVQK
jgi:hypothetical protein